MTVTTTTTITIIIIITRESRMWRRNVFSRTRPCVCLSVTWKNLDLQSSFLVCMYIFIISGSSAYIKVIDSRSKSEEHKSISVYPVHGWSALDWKAVLLLLPVCSYPPKQSLQVSKNMLIDLLLPFGIMSDSGGLVQKRTPGPLATSTRGRQPLMHTFSYFYHSYSVSTCILQCSVTNAVDYWNSNLWPRSRPHAVFFLTKLNESWILITRKLHSCFRFVLVARGADHSSHSTCKTATKTSLRYAVRDSVKPHWTLLLLLLIMMTMTMTMTMTRWQVLHSVT